MDEVINQCKQDLVNKPCKECGDVKEAHSNLLGECKGFEDYYLNAREAKVADK